MIALYFKMAWKNLWRNRSRTTISMAAIFFAVLLAVSLTSLQKGIFRHFIRNMVGFYSGYIQVHQKGYWAEKTLDNTFEDNARLKELLTSHSEVATVAPRLESYSLISSDKLTKTCMVTGIDPLAEDAVTHLKKKIIQGRYLDDPGSSGQVLLSQGLAERLKSAPGDTVVLVSQGYHGAMAAGKYAICGILRFGSPELNDQLLFMHVATAQELYGAPGLLTSYVLDIRNSEQAGPLAAQLQQVAGGDYEVMSWAEMLPVLERETHAKEGSNVLIIGVLYLLIGFGILGTLIMMMGERKYELGMLLAIGMKKWQLSIVLAFESILTVLLGCLIGIAISIPVVYYFEKNPIRFSGEFAATYEKFGFEPIFPAVLDPQIFLNQTLAILFMGLFLSLYPLYKIGRADTISMMKK